MAKIQNNNNNNNNKQNQISKITGREVLDSRGNPTIEATVHVGGFNASAIVPSGASTGIYEACELRDHDKRYHGNGVLKAINNIKKIERKLIRTSIFDQPLIDKTLTELDGTKNKTNLGANSILAVSLACARTGAIASNMPFYKYISSIFQTKQKTSPNIIPVPFCNIINGGKHAGNKLNMQEFMIAPVYAKSFSEGMRMVSETYHTLKSDIQKKYGKIAINVGDEGGFAPPIAKAEDALKLIKNAIDKTGYSKYLKIAMDPAASEFYLKNGNYMLHKKFSGQDLQKYYKKLISDFDIISIEDPFEQNDFENFSQFTKSTKIQIVGDDLLVTNVDRINIALKKKLCNALLLKVNQIGSLSEALSSANLAMQNKWNVMVSHRSGDTEDTFLADLAVGTGCGQIKIGAPCRGERTAKYNRLIRIEEELGKKAKYAHW